MTGKRLLLVTGSRALDETPALREWATQLLEGVLVPPKRLLTPTEREHAEAALDALSVAQLEVLAARARRRRAWDVLLTGGCAGCPDAWARDIAERARIPWVEYRLDGWRYGSDGKRTAWWADPHPDRPHPHDRNQAMVNLLGRQQEAGWSVRVFGLVAPWSRTRGAAVTLEKARAAGLPTTDHYAPDGLRPSGSRGTAKP